MMNPPAIRLRSILTALFERKHRDLQFDRVNIVGVLRHEQHGVGRPEHRHHDRADQAAVGRDDVFDWPQVLVKAQVAGGVGAKMSVRGFDRIIGHHHIVPPMVAATMRRSMTLIAASIAVHSDEEVGEAISRGADAAKSGAQLIEWRIDGLAEHDDAIHGVRRLVRESPVPCIVTCRPTWEGGEYEGDEQTRISLLEALATSESPEERPRYVDLELKSLQRSANLRQKALLAVDHPQQARDVQTGLILSSHDFDGRPADLLQRIEAMTNDPACKVIKVAWTARSLRDNLEAFELLRSRRKPTIALCMGRFGLMSRVLAPKFGGFLTFATDREEEVTAPGQPTIDELKSLYRFDRIDKDTKVYGVIGWPVEHSRSPQIHNAGFAEVNHDGVYLPMPIPPEYEHFKATVGAMIDFAGLDFRGASVTIPHKENLVRFVRERGGRLDELSEKVGAANTLVIGSAGGLECMNTDAPAAVASLCAGMGIEERELADKRIAIIGAGGVARSLAAGLLRIGATVVVFNRNQSRAEQLVNDLACAFASSSDKIAAGKPDALACGCFHVFINCTPVGMAGGPMPDESPLPDDVPLNDEITVMDTVYTPERTPLIQEAVSRGARVITGMDLFIRQGSLQFERWTGSPLPPSVINAD